MEIVTQRPHCNCKLLQPWNGRYYPDKQNRLTQHINLWVMCCAERAWSVLTWRLRGVPCLEGTRAKSVAPNWLKIWLHKQTSSTFVLTFVSNPMKYKRRQKRCFFTGRQSSISSRRRRYWAGIARSSYTLQVNPHTHRCQSPELNPGFGRPRKFDAKKGSAEI